MPTDSPETGHYVLNAETGIIGLVLTQPGAPAPPPEAIVEDYE